MKISCYVRTNLLKVCMVAGLIQPLHATDVFQQQRERWFRIAEESKPQLYRTAHHPVRVVKAVQDPKSYQGWRYVTDENLNIEQLEQTNFRTIRELTLDLGDHMTGHLSLTLRSIGSSMDAPTRLRIFMGEVPAEMNTPLDPWKGSLSRSWMQDEIITIENPDEPVTLPRRISGRYIKISLIACSRAYNFALSHVTFTSETSAKPLQDDGLNNDCPQIVRDIDRVGKSTLRECMQTVYEDGPKRDRRLWIGDMYLESLANRYSFQNHLLTKRCLYLFAALSHEDGILYGNAFEYPQPHPEIGNYMVSYNLLYILSLLEYYRDTNDLETVRDLWPVAKRQMEDAISYVNKDGIFDQTRKNTWNFFDWRDGIDVNACIQALTIDALKCCHEMGTVVGEETKEYLKLAKQMTAAARKQMFDRKSGLIVSGKDNQVSVISQAWMIRVGVLTPKEGQRALQKVMEMPEAVRPGTPYATHFLIEAMIMSGMTSEAKEYLTTYWGGMVSRGADTFFEAYDPQDDFLSPYRFSPLNSYCHAWSCTPIYFIHKYPEIFQK